MWAAPKRSEYKSGSYEKEAANGRLTSGTGALSNLMNAMDSIAACARPLCARSLFHAEIASFSATPAVRSRRAALRHRRAHAPQAGGWRVPAKESPYFKSGHRGVNFKAGTAWRSFQGGSGSARPRRKFRYHESRHGRFRRLIRPPFRFTTGTPPTARPAPITPKATGLP